MTTFTLRCVYLHRNGMPILKILPGKIITVHTPRYIVVKCYGRWYMWP